MIGQIKRVAELEKLKNGSSFTKNEKIYAFVSGKGGTGKTFICVNLAFALAALKKKILVIDLDSNLSNTNIILNIAPDKKISSYFSKRKLLKESITKVDENVDFIFGDSGNASFTEPSLSELNTFFNELRDISLNYDFVFLDTSSGVNDYVLKIISEADASIIVTTPEPTSIMDAYAVNKLLRLKYYYKKPYVLLNKCEDKADAEVSFENLQKAVSYFLKGEICYLGYVNYSKLIPDSIRKQNLLVKTSSSSEAANEIKIIAHALTKFNHLANITHLRKSV